MEHPAADPVSQTDEVDARLRGSVDDWLALLAAARRARSAGCSAPAPRSRSGAATATPCARSASSR